MSSPPSAAAANHMPAVVYHLVQLIPLLPQLGEDWPGRVVEQLPRQRARREPPTHDQHVPALRRRCRRPSRTATAAWRVVDTLHTIYLMDYTYRGH